MNNRQKKETGDTKNWFRGRREQMREGKEQYPLSLSLPVSFFLTLFCRKRSNLAQSLIKEWFHPLIELLFSFWTRMQLETHRSAVVFLIWFLRLSCLLSSHAESLPKKDKESGSTKSSSSLDDWMNRKEEDEIESEREGEASQTEEWRKVLGSKERREDSRNLASREAVSRLEQLSN